MIPVNSSYSSSIYPSSIHSVGRSHKPTQQKQSTDEHASASSKVNPQLPAKPQRAQPHFGIRALENIMNESLCRAASTGNLSGMQSLLRKVDINYASPYIGKTALMLAAENNKPEVIRLLLRQRSINLEKYDHDRRTALMLAAKMGAIPCMEVLLLGGARLHNTDRVGMNALLIAVNNNQKEAVKFLLDKGMPIESTDYLGRTPLLLAAERGFTAIIRELIHKNANIEACNFERMTPLMMACRENQLQAAIDLMEAGADVNRFNQFGATPLMLAAREGHLAVVKQLLAKGAHVNALSNTWDSALILAAENGHADIVETLLSKGANAGQVHRDGYTALIQAVRLGHVKTAKTLLQKPQDIRINQADRHGLTALGYAIDRNQHQLVEALLAVPGIHLEQEDNAGNTPLLLAARHNSLPMVELLASRQVNVNHANQRGETALHYAARHGNLPLVKRLMELGAQPDRVNLDGAMPLLIATQARHNRVMDWLIQQEGNLQRPYTRPFQQLQNFMDAVAATVGLDRNQEYPALLSALAERNDFNLAEQFLLANGKPLSALPWVLRNEAAGLGLTPALKPDETTTDAMVQQNRSERDQAWRNIEFLARNQVDFTASAIELGQAFKRLKHQKSINAGESAFGQEAPVNPEPDAHPIVSTDSPHP